VDALLRAGGNSLWSDVGTAAGGSGRETGSDRTV
jgi:hypothetical protein